MYDSNSCAETIARKHKLLLLAGKFYCLFLKQKIDVIDYSLFFARVPFAHKISASGGISLN